VNGRHLGSGHLTSGNRGEVVAERAAKITERGNRHPVHHVITE
jgi:hypothetical protein